MPEVIACLWGHAGLDRAAQGLLGAGRRLADALGGQSGPLIVGSVDDALVTAVQPLADAVVVVEDELLADYNPENFLAALTAACQQLSPRAVLLGNDAYSQELTPRLAHRLHGSAAGDAVDLAVVDGQLRVTRGVYGGKATAVIALARAPGVAWIRARPWRRPTPGNLARSRRFA